MLEVSCTASPGDAATADFDSLGLGRVGRSCIPNKFPGGADAGRLRLQGCADCGGILRPASAASAGAW